MPQFSDDQRFNTHLKKAKGYGSAHHGVHHWMMQKITALANVPLVVWLIYSILSLKGADYQSFTAWLATPLHTILMILLVISVFYHARLGAQVIVEDYVAEGWLRRIKLIALPLFFTAIGVATIFSILKIAFTAAI